MLESQEESEIQDRAAGPDVGGPTPHGLLETSLSGAGFMDTIRIGPAEVGTIRIGPAEAGLTATLPIMAGATGAGPMPVLSMSLLAVEPRWA